MRIVLKDGNKSFDDICNQKLSWWEKLYYFVWNRYRKIRDLPREIKWRWQRSHQGFADCDVWDFHAYIIKVKIGGLKGLKACGNSHPSDMTFEEWQQILTDMIEGFEIANSLISGDACYRFKTENTYFTDRMITKEQQKKHDRAFDLYKKHFHTLWD